jgi:hypothetical protein
MYMHTHIYIHKHKFKHIYTDTHLHTSIYQLCIHTYRHMYACVFYIKKIELYIYTNIQT